MHSHHQRAFTLVELLVVVAIIAVLAAILFPVLAQARSAARKSVCESNLKQIGIAMLMYASDWDEKFARTQTSDNPGVPGYISWWSTGYYEEALNAYIKNGKGGVNSGGVEGERSSVWWDPSDPDRADPAMMTSWRNNGLITGVSCSLASTTSPAHTIFCTLRVEHWKDYQKATDPGFVYPNPLPVNNPNDPFWFSDYFDICLNPWSYASNPSDPYYWAKGLASPPCEKFANDPTCIAEYRSIDGRYWNFPPEHPRYAGGHPFAFMDGHVKMLSFDQTYVSTTDNMWSTSQP